MTSKYTQNQLHLNVIPILLIHLIKKNLIVNEKNTNIQCKTGEGYKMVIQKVHKWILS